MRSPSSAALGDLGHGQLGLGATGPPLVDDDVAGDGEQPGPDRGPGPVEHGTVAPGAQQGLLRDVLGPGPVVAGQAQAVAPQRSGVLVVQLLHQCDFVVGHLSSPHETGDRSRRFSVAAHGPNAERNRSRNASIRHTGAVGRRVQSGLPVPGVDAAQHGGVLGHHGHRHVVVGARAGDDRGRLVVAEEHQHGAVVAVVLAGTTRSPTGSTRRTARTPPAPGPGDRQISVSEGSLLRHPVEHRPVPDGGLVDHVRGPGPRGVAADQVDLGHHRPAGAAARARAGGTRRGCTGRASSGSRSGARGSRRCVSRRAGRSGRTRPAASRGCRPARR